MRSDARAFEVRGSEFEGGRDVVEEKEISEGGRKLAQKCLECPVCRRARDKQKGLCFWFVKTIEGSLCPQCKAYERVYGRKAHEPLSQKST